MGRCVYDLEFPDHRYRPFDPPVPSSPSFPWSPFFRSSAFYSVEPDTTELSGPGAIEAGGDQSTETTDATESEAEEQQLGHFNFIHETWVDILRRAAALPPIWDHLARGNVDEDIGAWHFYNRLEDLRDYIQERLDQRHPTPSLTIQSMIMVESVVLTHPHSPSVVLLTFSVVVQLFPIVIAFVRLFEGRVNQRINDNYPFAFGCFLRCHPLSFRSAFGCFPVIIDKGRGRPFLSKIIGPNAANSTTKEHVFVPARLTFKEDCWDLVNF
jgi:hypothetical protein